MSASVMVAADRRIMMRMVQRAIFLTIFIMMRMI